MPVLARLVLSTPLLGPIHAWPAESVR